MKAKKIDLVLMHLFSWICGIIIPVLFINPAESSVQYFQKWTVDICFSALYFYFNIYWIIPEFLKKKRLKMYLFINLLIGLGLVFQQYLTERFFNNLIFDTTNVSMLILGRGVITFIWFFVLSNSFSYTEYIRENEKEINASLEDSKVFDEIPKQKIEF